MWIARVRAALKKLTSVNGPRVTRVDESSTYTARSRDAHHVALAMALRLATEYRCAVAFPPLFIRDSSHERSLRKQEDFTPRSGVCGRRCRWWCGARRSSSRARRGANEANRASVALGSRGPA